MENNTKKILIVDDNEINRMILSEMLQQDFDLIEASDGLEAMEIMKARHEEISLVLLDLVMPNMDGLEVLASMNSNKLIQDIQVIMISSEDAQNFMEKAYNLGAVDYISRPFNRYMVYRRILNTMMLYSKQKQLMDMVVDQIATRQKDNDLMIAILSHIVEMRNGESGRHVLNINKLTRLISEYLISKTDKYDEIAKDINIIRMASSLHDIGKICIPEEILNKPGRLTKEEFDIMKTHTTKGAEIISKLDDFKDETLVRYSYQICRHHHERWDGHGYPDGLKGDEIPIAAQIVSIADVYDALTSERCYKDAFSHDTAVAMIKNGECGQFNPLLLECLDDIQDVIRTELNDTDILSIEKSKQTAWDILRNIG